MPISLRMAIFFCIVFIASIALTDMAVGEDHITQLDPNDPCKFDLISSRIYGRILVQKEKLLR